MAYKINFEVYKNNFTLPQEIVGDDFAKLNGDYLKIILLIFKHSDKSYSENLLSNLLNISMEQVTKGINYWISKGVLMQNDEPVKAPIVLAPKKSAPPKPHSNSELTYIMDFMESCLKRPVTTVEYKSIMQILEFLKLPADVIIMAIEHCLSLDKLNTRYLEKVCTSWAENGITNHAAAELFLKQFSDAKSSEGKVKKLFGINDRALIESERNYIAKWFNEYHSSLEMIKFAYEKTISAINKPAFPYIDKILKTWHEKGYTTIGDVKKEGSPQKTADNSSYDIDEIDKFWDEVPKLI